MRQSTHPSCTSFSWEQFGKGGFGHCPLHVPHHPGPPLPTPAPNSPTPIHSSLWRNTCWCSEAPSFFELFQDGACPMLLLCFVTKPGASAPPPSVAHKEQEQFNADLAEPGRRKALCWEIGNPAVLPPLSQALQRDVGGTILHTSGGSRAGLTCWTSFSAATDAEC